MEIKLEDNKINLYANDREEPNYSIGWHELGNTIKINGSEISEWIDHLQNKSWVDAPGLYKLARKIHKTYPGNKIDWVENFYSIEKNEILNELELEKNSSVGKVGSNFLSLLNKLKNRRDWSIDLEKKDPNLVLRQVEKNLKLHGII